MIDISISIYQSQLPSGEFITDLMRKRVRQGQPTPVTITLDNQPATAYGWTDGVNSYVSTFIVFSSEKIQEIAIKLDPQNQ